MTIQHLSILSVPVSDPQQAKIFYVDVLGFTCHIDQEFAPGMRWIEVAPEGMQSRLSLVTWFPDLPAGSLRGNVLHTPDIAATCAQLEARGLRFEGPIYDAPGGRFADFRDPDGNGWMLNQPEG